MARWRRGRSDAAASEADTAFWDGVRDDLPDFPAEEPFAARIDGGTLTRHQSGLVLASAFGGRVSGMTAAAVNIPLAEGPDSPTLKRETKLHRKRPLKWQRDAWSNYDEVSEVRSGGRWMGDAQSRIRLFPALLSDDPDQPPVPAGEADGVSPADLRLAYDCLDRLQSDEGDRNEIQRVCGLNLFMVGEVWLVGTDEQPEFASRSNPTGERWRAFSVEEIMVTDRGRWGIRPHEAARDEECEMLDPETTRIIRVYRRHGRWRLWPDGSMRAANLIAEELLLQTQAIMGSLLSRLPAGIMPIPDDIEVTLDRDGDGAGDSDDEEPSVLDMLIKHMSAPKSDPRSAAGQVPFLMRLPAELIKSMPANGVWQLARDIDPQQAPRIEQLIHRLAIAFDMPPELLIGKGDINHWNAWEIDEDGVRLHVEPYTALYAQALTASYLRPRLELGGVVDPERWCLWWDPTDVMSHPDQKANAVKGYEATPPLVSGHVTRRALGYGDGDAPDDDELARIMEWRTKAATSAAPFGGEKQPPGEQHVSASAVVASAARGKRIGPALVKIEERLHRDLLGAADAAVTRTIEKAQARIRSLAQKDKTTRDQVANVSNDDLVATLGTEVVQGIGFDDDQLRDGFIATAAALLGFTSEARTKAVAALRGSGVDVPDDVAQEWERTGTANATEAGELLVVGLAALTAALLYDTVGPQTAPVGEFDPSFRVQPGLIREVLAAAGGGPGGASGGRAIPDSATGFLSAHDFDQVLGKLVREGDLINGGFAWAVGAPLHPFDPHQELDGLLFSDWNDPALAWDPGEFPYVSVLSPGDHDGCQCVVVPDGEVMTATEVDDEPPE